jgi:hypothetical protein
MFLSAVVAGGKGDLSAERFRELLRLSADPEEVVRQVLSRDEFRESPVQSLADRLLEFLSWLWNGILSWLHDHWPRLGPIEGNYEFFWTFLGILFYVVILGLLGSVLVLLVIRVILPALRKWSSGGSLAAAVLLDQEENAEPSREEVTQLASQGKFSAALVRLFRLILVQLDSRGQVVLHRSRTTREILDAISPRDPVRATLAEMVTVFNAVRYGAAPCGRAEFDRFMILADRVTGRQ